MKTAKLVVLIMMIALALFLILPSLSWAQDSATVYKTKCAACHGADLGGKPAAKTPSLVCDDAKKLSDGGNDKKASHAFTNKGVTPDQIKMIVSYIRDAQKR